MRKASYKYKFYYHITRTAISKALGRGHFERTEAAVRSEYNDAYAKEATDDTVLLRGQDVFINGKHAYCSGIGYKKFYLKLFAEKLRAFEIASVVELGSGRGLNLLTLAALCPSLRKLRGVELSPEGVKRASDTIANPPLEVIAHMSGMTKDEVARALAGKDIAVVEGSIRDIPFADGEFEACYSNSVIEQIPRDYDRVFRQAARVSTKIGMFSEPFFEAQQYHPFKLLHLSNLDYFKAPVHDVTKYGWRIFEYEVPSLQKYAFNTGFLTCIRK